MIRAETVDGSYIQVAPKGLDLLLKHGWVKRFYRETGWAIVGVDPIRECARGARYEGPERRYAA